MTTGPAGARAPRERRRQPIRDPYLRALLIAVGAGVLVGVCAALGWARETPAALGFFTFAGVCIGARAVRPPKRARRR